MKRLTIISILVLLMVLVTGTLIISNQGNENSQTITTVEKHDEKPEKKSCCSSEMESSEFSDNSIYQVNSLWKNQNSKTVNLANFKDENVVLAMIFANCTYACPIIVNDMRKIESSLSKSEIRKTKFVLVSIDSERDTPEALKEYSKKQNLDLSRWELLTGSESNIQELAMLFGFKYKKDEKGDFSHSNLINLLDKKGEIAYQHEGLNKDISDVVNKIKSLN